MSETSTLSTGTVTFLFTDIEGSTRLWEQQSETMHRDLARHDALLRAAIEGHKGHVFKTVGDAFYAAFADPREAAEAALEAQRALQRELPHVRVRMAVHTGHAEQRGGDYFGPALNHVARLLAAGHGGQVLLSQPTAEEVQPVLPEHTSLRLLGHHRLRDIAAMETIFQLEPPDLPSRFPPLNTLDVAFRRGVVRASGIAGVVLLIMLGLTTWAIENGHAADRNARRADEKAAEANNNAAAARREAGRADQNAATATHETRVAEARRKDAVAASAEAQKQRNHAEASAEAERRAARRARLAELHATDEAKKSRRLLYASQMSLAQQALDAADVTRAQELLVAQRPEPGQEDLRGWEWRYLWQLVSKDDSAATLQPGRGSIYGVAFSPDGRLLATASWPNQIKLWDVGRALTNQAPTPVASLNGVVSEADSVTFSPDGRMLVTGHADKTLRLWDLARKRVSYTLAGQLPGPVFSPDGRLLATKGADKTVRLWDVGGTLTNQSPRETAALKGYENAVRSLAFSPDGRLLATAGGDLDHSVWLWDVHEQRVVARFGDSGHRVGSLAFSPDGRTLAGALTATGGVKLWDVATRQVVGFLAGHRGDITSVVFGPDGTWLATAGGDYTVKLWRRDTLEEIGTLRGHRGGISCLALSPDGRSLATGTIAFACVKLWRATAPEEEMPRGHRSAVPVVLFTPDGKRLVSGSRDGTIKLWDSPTRRPSTELPRNEEPVVSMALTRNSRTLAVGSDGKTVTVWDLPTGRRVATLKRKTNGPCRVAFSPDGRLLAMGSDTNTVSVWNVFTWRQTAALKGPPDFPTGGAAEVVGLAFSPDGRLLASAGGVTVKLWDVASWREIGSLALERPVPVTFSPDGNLLVAGCADKTASVWDVRSRRVVAVLKGHTRQIRWVGFSPDGKTLATAGEDQSLRFWSTASWLEVTRFNDADLNPYAVAFSPDGQTIARGGTDGTIRLLRAAAPAESEPQVQMAWHLKEAGEAERASNWSAAIAHLNCGIARDPSQSSYRWHRAWAHAELGQWHQASADFLKYREMELGEPGGGNRDVWGSMLWLLAPSVPRPRPLDGWNRDACVQLALGDRAGYRKVCAEMLGHFAKNEDPEIANGLAWTCVMAPGAVSDPAVLVRWAEKALASRFGATDSLNTLGAALYRADRFEEATRRLREAGAEGGHGTIAAWLFLAMAHARLGHLDEARRWLGQAAQEIDLGLHRKLGDPGGAPLDWTRRLIFQLLRREAEALVKQAGGRE